MSEAGDKQSATHNPTSTPAAAAPTPQPQQQADKEQLSKLMAEGSAPKAPDLDGRALAAAEAAIAEGQRALDEARAQLRQQSKPAAAKTMRGRELALRVLLAINLVAMVVVALLPSPRRTTATEGHGSETPEHAGPAPEHDPVVTAPRLDDPVLRAFAAADRRDYKTAITILEQYLTDSPRLDPAKKANVLLALEHYATQIGDMRAAQEYQRKTEALRNSHSLPEDLIQMALEAEKNGDVESMRRHYARLLLQQRQIPSSLYKHVAEAYLKLGDSYRQEAEQSEQKARAAELEALRTRLRQQAAQDGGKTK